MVCGFIGAFIRIEWAGTRALMHSHSSQLLNQTCGAMVGNSRHESLVNSKLYDRIFTFILALEKITGVHLQFNKVSFL